MILLNQMGELLNQFWGFAELPFFAFDKKARVIFIEASWSLNHSKDTVDKRIFETYEAFEIKQLTFHHSCSFSAWVKIILVDV